MPKAPIQSRTLYYDTLNDKSIVLLEWCTVDTELGPMVEQRQSSVNTGSEPNPAVDVVDASFTYLRQLDGDTFYSQFGTGGYVVDRNYVY